MVHSLGFPSWTKVISPLAVARWADCYWPLALWASGKVRGSQFQGGTTSPIS